MKNSVFQLSERIKTFIKASHTNNVHTGERFVAATTFEGMWGISFQREYKKCSIFWSVWVLFTFLGKRKPQKYFLFEVFLVFCQRVYLFRKIAIWNVGYVSAYFCGG